MLDLRHSQLCRMTDFLNIKHSNGQGTLSKQRLVTLILQTAPRILSHHDAAGKPVYAPLTRDQQYQRRLDALTFALDGFFRHMETSSPMEYWRNIRTWANAWTTSLRTHEDVALPCIVGCFEHTVDYS